MNLATAFTHAVARRPDAIGFVDDDRRIRFAEWRAMILRLAGGLAGLGLRPGDHLAAVMRNGFEMASLYWAAQHLGLVMTPISWRGTAEEIAYCLRDCGAAALAYDGASGPAAGEAAAEAGLAGARVIHAADARGDGTAFERLLEAPALGEIFVAGPAATALMIYTSGTTGRPKGVPRSHLNELAGSYAHIAHNRLPFTTASLGVMPLFHIMGLRVLLTTALLNGAYVAMGGFDPGRALELIEAERVGSIFLVPTMYHDMARAPRLDASDLSSLYHVGYAGMVMAPALEERCREIFRPELFVNYYGSSEIYTFSFCDRLDEKPGSAGRPGLNQTIRVVGAEAEGGANHDDIKGPGEVGEIIAAMSSPEAFAGYWRLPQADAKAIRAGWYYTGDLGMKDADGDLFILGRVDDMIISGGENIHPEEVEDVALRSGLAADVAVVGLADERLGQRVVAFVVPADGAVDGARLDQAYLASELPRFKRPRDYVLVSEMPRSASGKLLRRMLRDGKYQPWPGAEAAGRV